MAGENTAGDRQWGKRELRELTTAWMQGVLAVLVVVKLLGGGSCAMLEDEQVTFISGI